MANKLKPMQMKQDLLSANIDGSGGNHRQVSIYNDADGIALDYLSQNIYYTSHGTSSIIICSLKTVERRCSTLLKAPGLISWPNGIVVHPQSGLLVYSDWSLSKPHIGIAGMDGNNHSVLVNESIWSVE